MKSVDNKEILPGFSFNMSAMGMGIHNWVGTCLIHQNFMSQSLSILLLMLAYFFYSCTLQNNDVKLTAFQPSMSVTKDKYLCHAGRLNLDQNKNENCTKYSFISSLSYDGTLLPSPTRLTHQVPFFCSVSTSTSERIKQLCRSTFLLHRKLLRSQKRIR